MAVQDEDWGPWIHQNIVRPGSEKLNGRCYKVWMMKTGFVITRTKSYVTVIPISALEYLRNEMMKPTRQNMDNKLNEICYRFTREPNSEGNTEMGRKDTKIKAIHSEEYRDAVQDKKISQYKVDNPIRELKPHRHMQMQENLNMTRSGQVSRNWTVCVITRI